MSIRFSIVIPSYQQAAFLGATLTSVAAEVTAEDEVIIRDGGSTDGSVELIRAFRCAAPVHWHSEPDGGQARALNLGFAEAHGRYRAFLNSDDLLYPGALARVAAWFEAHPASRIVYGAADHLREDGAVEAPYPIEPWSYERLQFECFLCQPATFWRREFAEEFGDFDVGLRYALDYEYWLRAGRRCAFDLLEGAPLAGSRVHSAAKTFADRIPAHREYLQVVQRHGGSRAAILKWLRALAQLRACQPTPPPDRLGLARRYVRELLRGMWEFRIVPGRDLLAEAKAALVARKYSHMLGR